MANDSSNVFVGKPKAGGAVYVAPAGTALPTDASTALAEAYKCLGFISEDGVTQTIDTDNNDFKAWGGETVASEQASYDEQQQMTFIEQNEEVFKQVYGESNVTGTWATGISVKHNANLKSEYVYVVETVLGTTRVNRLVIPRGKVIELGDVVRKDDELFGYETTIKCLADSDGNTAYEYYATVGSASTSSNG